MPFLIGAPQFRQTEAEWQGQILKYAKLMGWRHYHTRDSRRSPAGFPDLVLVRRPRLVFAEVKGQRTPITSNQKQWIEALRECGQEAYIWRPSDWERVERILR